MMAGIIFSRIPSKSCGGILNVLFAELSLFVINVEKYPSCFIPWADPEGDRGSGPPPPEKSQKLRIFFSNTGPDPLENPKATKPEFNAWPSSARQRNAI